MMHCPVCASSMTTVVNSRPIDVSVRRRRQCVKCDYRWSTYEISAEAFNALTDLEAVLDQARASLNAQAQVIEGLRLDGKHIKTAAGIRAYRPRRYGPLNSPEEMKLCRAGSAIPDLDTRGAGSVRARKKAGA